MKVNVSIIALIVLPTVVFSQTVKLDTRGQLAGFFRLSQNDFEIDSKSVAATEKNAYTANKAADTDNDGKITYSEYLNYLNKVNPGTISQYDLVLSALLPALKEFSFSVTGGTVGSGILTKDYVLPGNIVLPAGVKITITADTLLVSGSGIVHVPQKTVSIPDSGYLVFPFFVFPAIKVDKGNVNPLELDVEKFKLDIVNARSSALCAGNVPMGMKTSNPMDIPFNRFFLDLLGGESALLTLTPSVLAGALNRIIESNVLQYLDLSSFAEDPNIKEIIGFSGVNRLTWFDRMYHKNILKALFPNTFVDPAKRTGYFYLFPEKLDSDRIVTVKSTLLTGQDVIKEILTERLNWFRANPPAADGSNFEARRTRSLLLDQLGFDITTDDWYKYRRTKDPALERQYPILSYLRIAEQRVLEEARTSTVNNGVRIWKLYNMGVIVKTPDKCFAIDLVPLTADFSSVLDFAISSHWHDDHVDEQFFQRMIKLKKPVYVTTDPGRAVLPGFTLINKDTILQQGSLTINFKMSAQTGYAAIPCLISTIDCGPAAGSFLLMHSGDANQLEHFPMDRPVDFLEYHLRVGLEADSLLARVKPIIANLGHIMELGHGVGDARWPYSEAYTRIENANSALPGQLVALTWGESLFFAAEK